MWHEGRGASDLKGEAHQAISKAGARQAITPGGAHQAITKGGARQAGQAGGESSPLSFQKGRGGSSGQGEGAPFPGAPGRPRLPDAPSDFSEEQSFCPEGPKGPHPIRRRNHSIRRSRRAAGPARRIEQPFGLSEAPVRPARPPGARRLCAPSLRAPPARADRCACASRRCACAGAGLACQRAPLEAHPALPGCGPASRDAPVYKYLCTASRPPCASRPHRGVQTLVVHRPGPPRHYPSRVLRPGGRDPIESILSPSCVRKGYPPPPPTTPWRRSRRAEDRRAAGGGAGQAEGVRARAAG